MSKSPVKLSEIKRLFNKLIVPFHLIIRDTTLPLPDHRGDNDAEHSWSLTFLAVALAPEVDASFDVGLVSIFSAVHDVVEVYAGDTSVWADDSHIATKQKREETAITRLKQEFPQFAHLGAYIDEYERKASNEAKFVYALDKFLNMLTIVEDNGYYYHTRDKLTKQQVVQRLEPNRKKAHTHPVIGKYYDELRELFDADPEHFYQQK